MTPRLPFALWTMTLALVVITILVSGWQIGRSVAASFDSGQTVRLARTSLIAVVRGQLDEETGMRGFTATRDRIFLEPYKQGRAELEEAFLSLDDRLRLLDLAQGRQWLAQARATNDTWVHSVAEPLIARRGPHDVALQRLGKGLVDRFRIETDQIETELGNRNALLREEFQSELAAFEALVALTAALLCGAGALFGWLQYRSAKLVDAERAAAEEARVGESRLQAAYEVEKRVADTLQEAFLQRQLPTLPTISFSATYVPAAEEAKVGGDWYDAFEIGPQRILFTIGDIAGHGIGAAVAMSRVRNQVLSSALLEGDPASILTRVNGRVLEPGYGDDTMVTAVVGIADAERYEFTYSTAGHPPPILLEPGRAPRTLPFGGMPLGISAKAAYRTHAIQSVPGAILVLYTDGVIEHSRNVLDGERELLEAVASVADGSEAASSIYRSIFANRAVGDDVAILTIGFTSVRRRGLVVASEDGSSTMTGAVRRPTGGTGLAGLRAS